MQGAPRWRERKPKMRNCEVLAIVVTYNGEATLRRCLDSIAPAHPSCDTLVIDNASTDGSLSISRSYEAIQVLPLRRNYGFGRANNVGFAYAIKEGYKYVLLLNQDAYVESETIRVLREELNAHNEFGVLSPMHLSENGRKLDKNFAINLLSLTGEPELLSDLYCLGRSTDLRAIYQVKFAPAALWMVRCESVKELGGFDPLFPHYGEDTDFCMRADYHNTRVGVVPRARGYHLRISPALEKGSAFRECEKLANRYFVELLIVGKVLRRGLGWCAVAWLRISVTAAISALKKGEVSSLVAVAWSLGKVGLALHKIVQSRKESRQLNRGGFLKESELVERIESVV